MRGMMTGNRMPLGKTTLHGLPEGRVHLAAFANDNNPGFGGVSCELKPHQTVYVSIPLIASWSNGHKDPPEHLEDLVSRMLETPQGDVVELLREQNPEVAEALAAARGRSFDPWSRLIPILERKVRLDQEQPILLKDLLAAEGYAQLLKHAEARRQRQKDDRLKKAGVDPSVGYDEAFRDLHEKLGREYPCFELKKIDWTAVGERLLPRVKDVRNDEEFGLLCCELVACLEDSHAQLLSAAAPLPTLPLPSWDAGFACLEDDREKPVVYWIASDGSAKRSDLQIGMTVVSINGKQVEDAIRETKILMSRYIGYSSQRYLRYHAYRFFARQKNRGDKVELTVVTPDGHEQTLTLVASQRAGYVPRLPVPREGIPDAKNVSWKMLDDDIAYIYVRRIRADLINSLNQAIAAMRNARGLIVDVRGNSGGGFDAARALRNFDPEDSAEPERPRFAGPIALLIDARCISAGEGWASWFVARKRARLFGEATAGASSRKTTYLLRNGLFSVRYPVKAYRGYLDRPIERRGLEPDVVVRQDAGDLVQGRDTVLETAKRYLVDAAASAK
jgi:C-terminal processing protease CtpA/Prc